MSESGRELQPVVGGRLVLLGTALVAALVSVLLESEAATRAAATLGAGASVWILWRDAREAWQGRIAVGRVTLDIGIFYWFWIDAVVSAWKEPAFPTPEPLYPYFDTVVPLHVVAIGLVCVNAFAIAANLGWAHAPQPTALVKWLAGRRDYGSVWMARGASILFAGVAWIPSIITWGSVSTALVGMVAMRSGGGPDPIEAPGTLQQLLTLGICAAAFSLTRVLTGVGGATAILDWVVIAVMAPLLVLGSTRFFVAFMVLPALLALIGSGGAQREWRRNRGRALTVVAAMAAVVLVQGAARGIGLQAWLDNIAKSGEVTDTINEGAFGHEQFGAMLIAIDLVTDRNPLFMEPISPFFVTHFVPRGLWPEKPYSKSWTFYNAKVTAGHAFNVTPSITGQYYMNWGLAGVLWIGVFMGWLSRLSEKWLQSISIARQTASAAEAGLLLAFVFLSFRFFYPLYFAYPLFGFFIYWLFSASPSIDGSFSRERGSH